MLVSLSLENGFKFAAKTARGASFEIDPKNGASPLEYFALGAIACTAVDIVSLPEKSGKAVKNLKIDGDFARTETAPYRFSEIHVSYFFDSDGSDLDAKRWVLSSLESYCTTLNTVRGVARVRYSITHNAAKIADGEYIASGAPAEGSGGDDFDGGGACPA